MNTETKKYQSIWDKTAFVVPATNMPQGIPLDLGDFVGLSKLEYATLKAMQGDLSKWHPGDHSAGSGQDHQIKDRGEHWIKCAISALEALDKFRKKNTPPISESKP